jgi:hypothetical protein
MPSPSSAEPSSSATTVDEVRPQAGPLPSKLGEIGYQEQPGQQSNSARRESDSFPALPARHPADRDSPVPPPSSPRDDDDPPSTALPSHETSSTHSGKSSILSFFKHKNLPAYFGIGLASWIALSIHIIFLAGTVTLWVYSAQRLNKFIAQQNGSGGGGGTSAIFVHVIFAIFVTGQLLFLERRIFRLRAERYMHLHQDEMLPTHNPTGLAYMGFAPWNRPPLPTYAAALAQSGVGTGDVEDHLIAALPPPAYGNTRGSRLLLSGFLRESLRAQRPQSQGSDMGHHGERPLSYVSRDEEVRDSERAQALATLENAHLRS